MDAKQLAQVVKSGTNGASTALEASGAILAAVSQPITDQPTSSPQAAATPTVAELMAQIAALTATIAANVVKKAGAIEFRITDKGGVSVYGMGRFPVTLYQEQWDRLIAVIPELKAFLEENRSKLSSKPVKGK